MLELFAVVAVDVAVADEAPPPVAVASELAAVPAAEAHVPTALL